MQICGLIGKSALLLFSIAGCASRYFNNMPEKTTLVQLLKQQSVVLFDSTGIIQKTYMDEQSMAASPLIDAEQGSTENMIHYLTQDSLFAPKSRTMLIHIWDSMLVADSATVANGKSITTPDLVSNNCSGYAGAYAVILDSLAVNPSFPPMPPMLPGMHREPPPEIPKPELPPGAPPMPPMPKPELPGITRVSLSYDLSVVRLRDCKRILNLGIQTEKFEVIDAQAGYRSLAQSVAKALVMPHDSLMLHALMP